MDNEIEIDELMLLSGAPYKVAGVGRIRSWKLIEVASMGEREYSQRLNKTCFDTEDLMGDMTEEELLKLEGITTFDIIFQNCMSDDTFKSSLIGLFEDMFEADVSISEEDDSLHVQYKDEPSYGVINRDNYEHIKYIIRKQNCISTEKREQKVAGNEQASEFMKKMEEIKNKYQKFADKKNMITTTELVNAVAWKSGISINEAFQMTVYQLHQALSQLSLVDNYENTMLGVYTGNVDMKKVGKDLNWIKGGDSKK